MNLNKLTNAYQEAMGDYDAAQAGIGNRVETFTRFLMAEKVLATRWRGLIKDWSGSGRAIQRDWTTPPVAKQSAIC
jgi:hypothetical protein